MLAKSTEYAIRALTFVQIRNWEQKRPGVIEIAQEIKAPKAFTAKILHILSRHRLLVSMKGRGGGFFFNNNQSDLTLYDVIHIMEGDALFHKCVLGLKECDGSNPCPLHDKYIYVRNGFQEMARTETIHSLSQKIRSGNAVLTHHSNMS